MLICCSGLLQDDHFGIENKHPDFRELLPSSRHKALVYAHISQYFLTLASIRPLSVPGVTNNYQQIPLLALNRL